MATKYASLQEREGHQRIINDAKKVLSNPVAWDKIQAKESFKKQLSDMENHLAEVTPPDIDDSQRQAYHQRTEMLVEAMRNGKPEKGIPPMPSRTEMWKSPSGSTGKHLTWETFWKSHTLDLQGNIVRAAKGRGAIFEWKDRARTLGKGGEHLDPDISNIERFRPGNNLGESKFIDYRSFTMSPGDGFDSYEAYDEALGRTESDIAPQEEKVRAGMEELESQKRVEALLKRAEQDPELMRMITDLTTEVQDELDREIAEEESYQPVMCQKVKDNGESCKNKAKSGSQFCSAHLRQLNKE